MTVPGADERLPCGRRIQDLLDQVADGLAQQYDSHQQGCTHCQAALAEYDRLWAPVRDLAADPVEAPDSILETALEKIRQTVEHADYGLVASADGLIRISARVVVATARHSAQQVPGVRVALSKHLLAGDAPSALSVAAATTGRSTAIEITLAADYGTDLRELGERVRRTVAARVRELTDLDPATVTVIIDDVFPPPT